MTQWSVVPALLAPPLDGSLTFPGHGSPGRRWGHTMTKRLLFGPLLIVLWQAAPVGVEPGPDGRARITVGVGAGRLESRSISCEGDLLGADPVPYQMGGASVEYWLTDVLRMSGVLGYVSGDAYEWNAAFGGMLMAYEGSRRGFGLGLAHSASEEMPSSLSLYLRFGSLDGAHFRVDGFTADPLLGTTGLLRTGVGHNMGRRRGLSVYAGLGVGPLADEKGGLGPFVETFLPVTRHLDLGVQGAFRTSAQYPEWAVGVLTRLRL